MGTAGSQTSPPHAKIIKQSWLDLAGDPTARMIWLPQSFMQCGRKRELAYTLGSIYSWCKSRRGRSYDPGIAQIATRAGYQPRTVAKHIRLLQEWGYITRIRRARKKALTMLTDKTIEIYSEETYWEFPVAFWWNMPHLHIHARTVLAAAVNRVRLNTRLQEDLDGASDRGGHVDPSEKITVGALKRWTGIKAPLVRTALSELAAAKIPLKHAYGGWFYQFDPEGQTVLKYPENHDTVIYTHLPRGQWPASRVTT
ncbi:MAG: hypothetical protein ACYC3X_22615 [Pirellulaceae bacterium]